MINQFIVKNDKNNYIRSKVAWIQSYVDRKFNADQLEETEELVKNAVAHDFDFDSLTLSTRGLADLEIDFHRKFNKLNTTL